MSVRTTTAGWFPLPAALRRARWQHAEGEIDAAALRAIEREATQAAIRLQERLGLDQLVDGQLDRDDMASWFGERLGGMVVAGFVRCFGNRYYRKPRIVGEVTRDEPLTVESWRAAAAMTQKPVRAILTGPYTLMDWSFDEHYGSREAACLALAEAVRQEAFDLVQAGAVELELSEPAVSTRPEEMPLVAEALDRITRPLRARARIWTRIAYGDLRPVIGDVLRLPVDGLLLELANSRSEVVDALGGLPDDKQLGVGVVDVLTAEVESVDAIRGTIAAVAAHVPADRLWVMPDAGLRTLDAAAAEAKLRNLVTAAREFS